MNEQLFYNYPNTSQITILKFLLQKHLIVLLMPILTIVQKSQIFKCVNYDNEPLKWVLGVRIIENFTLCSLVGIPIFLCEFAENHDF